MTGAPPWLLGGIAALLTAIVAAEVVPSVAPTATHVALHSGQLGRDLATPPAEPDHLQTWIRTALARPPFRPDRRPAEEASAAAAGLPRLAGIVISPTARVAIFSPVGASTPVVAGVGGTIGVWTVTRISPGSIVIAGAGGSHVLRPTFRIDSATSPSGASPPYSGADSVHPPPAYLPAITRLLQRNPQ